MSTARSDLLFTGGVRTAALEVRRSPRARRLRLAVDPRDGAVRLTIPARAALAPAVAWASGQRAWVEAALAALPPPAAPIGPGGLVPFAGRELRIDWRADASRTPMVAGDMLRLGGPADLVAGRVLRWLRAEARGRLGVATALYADRAGVSVSGVAIGDPRSRWGSCSSSGAIRYSWRLVMAPAEVLEATAAHEVAHRLHMDHSPAFHAAVARLLGRDPKAERAWLRAHGARLHAFGREG